MQLSGFPTVANHATWAQIKHDAVPDAFPDRTMLSVTINGLTYACYFVERRKADTLLVTLWSGSGDELRRPVIKGTSYGRRAGAHLLAISDPTLFLDPQLRNGVFLGEEAVDPIDGVIELARAAAVQLDIPHSRIVFFGISAAGFGALRAGLKMGAGALVGNPITDLTSLRGSSQAQILINRFNPAKTASEQRAAFPARGNIASSYEEAKSQGRNPRIVYFQNIQDRRQHDRHFLPLCKALGMPATGGWSANGQFYSRVIDDPSGHTVSLNTIEDMFRHIPMLTGDARTPSVAAPETRDALNDQPTVPHHSMSAADGSSQKRNHDTPIAASRRRLTHQWVDEASIRWLSDYVVKSIGQPGFGICHGTRKGWETRWFKRFLRCRMIGTEIAERAEQFPDNIRWDFHEVKPEWIGKTDFIYSNSWDHSYDPYKLFPAWMSCLRPGGICILDQPADPVAGSETDPLSMTVSEMIAFLDQIADDSWSREALLTDAPPVMVREQPVNVRYHVLRKLK